MSDPVTNVEIEDVLSSIRRLVSDGDKARTRDIPPAEQSTAHPQGAENGQAESAESSTDRFVLTPALMVVEEDKPDESAEIEVEAGTDDGWFREDIDPQTAAENDTPEYEETGEPEDVAETDQGGGEAEQLSADEKEEPLELTNMVWEPIEDVQEPKPDAPETGEEFHLEEQEIAPTQSYDAPADEDVTAEETDTDEDAKAQVDRSDLISTIAELEAAVSGEADDFEPDGSEVMGQTIAWPGAVARNLDAIEDAESDHSVSSADAAQAEAPETSSEDDEATDTVSRDVYGDDDLDGLLEAGGVALDEEALRALVSEVVREELTGPLGERITRNVRKLVRREIYRILSSKDFD